MANTTSGSVTFDKTYAIDDIIAEAYERIGLVGTAGHQLLSAKRSLNLLFQEWGNRGLHYWEVANTNLTITQGQQVYTIYRSSADGTSDAGFTDAGVAETIYGMADISQCSFRQYNNSTGGTQADATMTKIDRSTYAAFANKKVESTPAQFWVQRFIDKTTLTIYPTANSTAAGSNNKLAIWYTKRIEDVGDAYTNATDIPYRFTGCMTTGLAFYLAQKYAPQRAQEMKLYYEDELARALQEDGSASSAYVTPKAYYPAIT